MLTTSALLYARHRGVNEGRVVLHSDLNNFFASVECKRRPELCGFPVAVCGSKKDRHGIVLAKNQKAKEYGVKTGQAIWQAKALCANLFVIEPDYDEYVKYSHAVKSIYLQYSDRVEPFGMDEAWIELTGDSRIRTLEDGRRTADEIRKRVKKETGLTVSVGVSDNKVFSKLASDYKKPDAVTVFGPDNYYDTVVGIDIGEMLFVGKNTKQKLGAYGIKTIGDESASSLMFMKSMFGKNGEKIFSDACGYNTSEVEKYGSGEAVKSVGNSVTLPRDLKSPDEVKAVFHALSEKVAWRLRLEGLMGTSVQISVRDTGLCTTERQCSCEPTDNALELADCAVKLYTENYDVTAAVRSVGVRMTKLVSASCPQQTDMFDNSYCRRMKRAEIDRTVDRIREKYGTDAVRRAVSCTAVF